MSDVWTWLPSPSLSALERSILLQLSYVLSKPEQGLQLTVYFCTKGERECACDGCQPNSLSPSHRISQDRPGNSFLMFFQITLILTPSATDILPVPGFNYRWQQSAIN